MPTEIEAKNNLEHLVDSVRQQMTQSPAREAHAVAPPADDWGTRGHDAVMRIPISIRIVLGVTRMPVSKLMSLTRGAIIPLDRKVGDLVDIVVNDRIIARGEVVILDEEESRFAVAVREVVRMGEP